MNTETETGNEFVIDVNVGGLLGTISLPDPEEFTGRMYDDFMAMNKKHSKGGTPQLRVMFYTAVDFIKKYGRWNVVSAEGHPISIDTALGWKNAPNEEPFKFVTFLGRQTDAYFVSIFDPKK